VKDNDGPDDAAGAIVDGGGRIFDGRLKAIAPDKDAVDSQAHGAILLDGHFQGVASRFAGGTVNDAEDLDEGFAEGFGAGPAGHGFGDQVEIVDVAGNIGGKNGVANGVEGDHGALFFDVQGILNGFAFDGVAERTRKRVAIEVIREEIVLCSAGHSLLSEVFGDVSADNQDRDVRSGSKELVEGVDARTVGQGECEEDSGYGFFREPRKTIGKIANPNDVKTGGVLGGERCANGIGGGGIVFDQEYFEARNKRSHSSLSDPTASVEHVAHQGICAIAYTNTKLEKINERVRNKTGPSCPSRESGGDPAQGMSTIKLDRGAIANPLVDI
jgi:hypothetical protein